MTKNARQWNEVLISTGMYNNLPPDRIEVLAQILSKLTKVSNAESATTISACCPAHPDSTPSLSVKLNSDGKILMTCHTGCDVYAIVDSMRMHMSTLFPYKKTVTDRSEAPHRLKEPEVTLADKQWEMKHREFRNAITPEKLRELADSLQLEVDALNGLEVGWSPSDDAWTFPERNADSAVCGILLRYANGTKRCVRGGKRGLTLPLDWDSTNDPLLICEGPTDTLAAHTSGCKAIGRASISSGFDDLAILLKSANRKIIVVADNDSKKDGRNGATTLAHKLTQYLSSDVYLWSPPEGYKDVREFVNGANLNDIKSK